MKEIPKAYKPNEVEDKWYKYWEDHNLFGSEIDETKTPYTIVIPPPNITGMLTMGHILNNGLAVLSCVNLALNFLNLISSLILGFFSVFNSTYVLKFQMWNESTLNSSLRV